MVRKNDLDPYESLSNAIVAQAATDYRTAMRALQNNPESKIALSEVRDIRKFFRSGWYSLLTSIDGEYLIEKLNEEFPDVYVKDVYCQKVKRTAKR